MAPHPPWIDLGHQNVTPSVLSSVGMDACDGTVTTGESYSDEDIISDFFDDRQVIDVNRYPAENSSNVHHFPKLETPYQNQNQNHKHHNQAFNIDNDNIPSPVLAEFETNTTTQTYSPQGILLSEAFYMLYDVYSKAKLNDNIPVRTRASPIYPSQPCFYLYSADPKNDNKVGGGVPDSERARVEAVGRCIRNEIERRKLINSSDSCSVATNSSETKGDKKKRKLGSGTSSPRSEGSRFSNPSEKKISVKFQSFNEKNSEVWWSDDHDRLFGVVARAMSKTARAPRYSGEHIGFAQEETKVTDRRHGYAGRMYSLILRTQKIRDSGNHLQNIRNLIVPQVPSLVQFWKISDHDELSPDASNSNNMNIFVRSGGCESKANEEQQLRTPTETIYKNIRIKGNLIVEGNISGTLVTPPGAADYAEWFSFLDPNENILPGMVVQLRSPMQKITLNTSKSGPHMVVSSMPSVAAGVPKDFRAARAGALCGFLGQVPVRVKGPVECGDFLFPSHENDGFAISHKVHDQLYKQLIDHADIENEPLGTAMESCGEGEHTILCFVRWQHNIKYQIMNNQTGSLKSSMIVIWLNCFWKVAETFCMLSYLFSRPHLVVERFFALANIGTFFFAALHFPEYYQFVERYDIIPFSILQICRLFYGFYKLCYCLADTSTDTVAGTRTTVDLFIAILLVIGSMTTLVVYVQLAVRYFSISNRPDNIIWRVYHHVKDVAKQRMVRSYNPRAKSWIDDADAYKNFAEKKNT